MPKYEGVLSSLSPLPLRTSWLSCLTVDSVKLVYVVLASLILSSHLPDQLSRLFSAVCIEEVAIATFFDDDHRARSSA
jgi:hypothetical protein